MRCSGKPTAAISSRGGRKPVVKKKGRDAGEPREREPAYGGRSTKKIQGQPREKGGIEAAASRGEEEKRQVKSKSTSIRDLNGC